MTERIRQWLLYSGLDKDEYDSIQESIRDSNYRATLVCGILLCVLFATLSICSPFAPHAVGALWPNLGSIGVIAILTLAALLTRKGKPGVTVLLFYLMVVYLCAYSIYFHVVDHHENSGVIFCGILLVAPIVLSDRPVRSLGITFAATLVYIVASAIRLGACDQLLINTGDAVSCFFFGAVLSVVFTRSRLREFLSSRLLEAQSRLDGLTGLLNKTAFEQQAAEYLGSGGPGTLVIIDIDDFKRVNDMYGHDQGDAALRAMADCIRQCFYPKDYVGRFGGDEFVVFMVGDVEPKVTAANVSRLLSLASVRVKLPEPKDVVCVSVGIALAQPGRAVSYTELFKEADDALYEAKRTGKNRYAFYEGAQA